jgi:inner membrane protein
MYFNLVENWILFFFALFLGSGFPDIDSDKSKFGRNIFSKMVSVFSKHRKIFHSLLLGLVLGYFLFGLDKDMGLGFFLGFLSHVILDGLSVQGINFLYPIGNFKLSGFVKTGGKLEKIIFYAIMILDISLVAKLLNLGVL